MTALHLLVGHWLLFIDSKSLLCCRSAQRSWTKHFMVSVWGGRQINPIYILFSAQGFPLQPPGMFAILPIPFDAVQIFLFFSFFFYRTLLRYMDLQQEGRRDWTLRAHVGLQHGTVEMSSCGRQDTRTHTQTIV